MQYKYLHLTPRNDILIISLDREQKRNCLNYDFLFELEHIALSLENQTHFRTVLFTGKGTHFSAGADLNEMMNQPDLPLIEKRKRWRIGGRAIRAIRNIDQVTVGAWQGGAIGGGACILSALDFRIASKSAYMKFAEIDVGLNLMWESLPLVTNLFGEALTKKLLIGGSKISAKKLHSLDIVEGLVESEKLMDEAIKLCQFLGKKSPVAAQMIKRSINQMNDALSGAIMHMDADQNLLLTKHSDQRTAVEAHLKSETALFRGD